MKRARLMFANYSSEPNKLQQQERVKLETLRRLNAMPRPNVKRLVRELLAEEGIAEGDRRFPHKAIALDKRIRRWQKNRAKIEAQFGGVSPILPAGQPAAFVIHDKPTSRKK